MASEPRWWLGVRAVALDVLQPRRRTWPAPAHAELLEPVDGHFALDVLNQRPCAQVVRRLVLVAEIDPCRGEPFDRGLVALFECALEVRDGAPQISRHADTVL